MTCTATLTTATVHDGCQWKNIGGCNHHNCVKFGSEWRHVELIVTTCTLREPDHTVGHESSAYDVIWNDGAPGATPHRPAVEVSDAEVDAAYEALAGVPWELATVRAALVAAYEAREAQP